MAALPAWPYFALLFLWDLSFSERLVGTRENIALSHFANALAPVINLAGGKCPFAYGSFFDRRVFHPGQSASYAHPDSQRMEPYPGLFACCNICSFREYQ